MKKRIISCLLASVLVLSMLGKYSHIGKYGYEGAGSIGK